MATQRETCGCVLTKEKRTGVEFWSSLCAEHAAVHTRWNEEHKLSTPPPPATRTGKGKMK